MLLEPIPCPETPKVAFAASLGGNGLIKTTSSNRDLVYRDVLTNIGGAYNKETGEAFIHQCLSAAMSGTSKKYLQLMEKPGEKISVCAQTENEKTRLTHTCTLFLARSVD